MADRMPSIRILDSRSSQRRGAAACAVLVIAAAFAGRAAGPSPSGDEAWRQTAPAGVADARQRLRRLRDDLQADRMPNLHAVLVTRHGEMLFEEYLGDAGRKRSEYTASVSKSVGSLVFGIAMDRGFLPGLDEGILDRTLVDLLPEYRSVIERDPAKAEVTLHHVLSMTAGLAWDEESHPYSDPRNDWHAASRSDDPVRFVLERPVVVAPGTRFVYNGGMSILLSYLIERETGERAEVLAREALFEPLGIHGARWERLACGLTDTDGGLHLRPRDMARIGQLVLDGGRWRGAAVVSRAWIETSTRCHVSNVDAPDYGYQWWCGDFHHHGRVDDAVVASGHGGQAIFVFPRLDAVVVICQDVFGNPLGPMTSLAILNRYVLPALDPASRIPDPVPLATRDLERYLGTYAAEGGPVAITITRRDGALRAEGTDGTAMDLIPLGDDAFRGTILDLLDLRLEFERGEAGDVERVRSSFGFRETVLERRAEGAP